MIFNGPFLKNLLDQNRESLALEKASNKQFQREIEVTEQVIRSCVKLQAWKEIYINELLINSQIHYNLIVIFICNVFCVYKKLFEKINITSEGLSMRHETQCNVKSEVLNCLMNIVIYSSTLKHWPL